MLLRISTAGRYTAVFSKTHGM